MHSSLPSPPLYHSHAHLWQSISRNGGRFKALTPSFQCLSHTQNGDMFKASTLKSPIISKNVAPRKQQMPYNFGSISEKTTTDLQFTYNKTHDAPREQRMTCRFKTCPTAITVNDLPLDNVSRRETKQIPPIKARSRSQNNTLPT